MTELVLHIGNKNYSSWSMRPWMAMKEKGIPFREELTPFDDTGGNPLFRVFSPTGRVPVLVDGTVSVWESLAIIEYVAEKFPEAKLWPEDSVCRARARAISMEMLSGFSALRSACPMNIRRPRGSIAVSDKVHADVARITQIWKTELARSGGPFLFRDFTGADAMYAPVVNRLEIYNLTDDPVILTYMDTVKATKAWQSWEKAARAEPWIVPADEV